MISFLHLLRRTAQDILAHDQSLRKSCCLRKTCVVPDLLQLFDQFPELIRVQFIFVISVFIFPCHVVETGLIKSHGKIDIQVVILLVAGLLELKERIFVLAHLPEFLKQVAFKPCETVGSRAQHSSLSCRDYERKRHLHIVYSSDKAFLALIQEQASGIGIQADLLFAFLVQGIIVQRQTDRSADHADPVAEITCREREI